MLNLLQEQSTGNQTTQMPFVSVIVPVRNEEKSIRNTLLQILKQNYTAERFEVIVADGESTDATCEIVRELQVHYGNLLLVPNPRRWSSGGRNAAIQASRGEIIVLIDGHCDVRNSNYLRDVVHAFEQSGADCLGRPQPLDVSEATTIQRAIAVGRSSPLGHHPGSHIYSSSESYVKAHSVAIAYRRAVFHRVGLFDERFDACEDVELNHRVDQANLRCFFSPKLAVHYHPRASFPRLFRQMKRYGRGRARLLKKHPKTFTPTGFIPAFFVLGLFGGTLLSFFSTLCFQLFAGTMLLYLTLLLTAGCVEAWRNRSWKFLPLIPLVLVTVHVGAGSGVLAEMLVPERSPSHENLKSEKALELPESISSRAA